MLIVLLYLYVSKQSLVYVQNLDERNWHGKAEIVAQYTDEVERYSTLFKNLMWIPFGILIAGTLVTLLVFFFTKRGVPAKLEKANAKLDDLKASYKVEVSDEKPQTKSQNP